MNFIQLHDRANRPILMNLNTVELISSSVLQKGSDVFIIGTQKSIQVIEEVEDILRILDEHKV